MSLERKKFLERNFFGKLHNMQQLLNAIYKHQLLRALGLSGTQTKLWPFRTLAHGQKNKRTDRRTGGGIYSLVMISICCMMFAWWAANFLYKPSWWEEERKKQESEPWGGTNAVIHKTGELPGGNLVKELLPSKQVATPLLILGNNIFHNGNGKQGHGNVL